MIDLSKKKNFRVLGNRLGCQGSVTWFQHWGTEYSPEKAYSQSGNTLSQFILAKLLNLSIQLKIVRKYKTCGACARMYCALVFDIGF